MGRVFEKGFSLVPLPAARIRAFIQASSLMTLAKREVIFKEDQVCCVIIRSASSKSSCELMPES